MSEQVRVKHLPTCQFCTNNTLASYDARTVFGSWAYLCEEHFYPYTEGRLGTGWGQRLILEDK